MEFVTEFFKLAKKKQVNTALDTSGNSFYLESSYLERFDRLMDLTDLFLLDIKAVDASLHKQLTGQDNAGILALAHYLADHGKSLWIRRVLVPGLTDSEEDLTALRDLARSLPTRNGWKFFLIIHWERSNGRSLAFPTRWKAHRCQPKSRWHRPKQSWK